MIPWKGSILEAFSTPRRIFSHSSESAVAVDRENAGAKQNKRLS
jgi:hypothetical protein